MRVRHLATQHPRSARCPLQRYFVRRFRFSGELMVSYFNLMIASDLCFAITPVDARHRPRPYAPRLTVHRLADRFAISLIAETPIARMAQWQRAATAAPTHRHPLVRLGPRRYRHCLDRADTPHTSSITALTFESRNRNRYNRLGTRDDPEVLGTIPFGRVREHRLILDPR